MKRVIVTSLFIAALIVLSAEAAEKAPDREAGPQVVRYGGAKQGLVLARPSLLINATAASGEALELIVPNKEAKSAKLDPDESMLATIKAAKVGELLEVQWKRESLRRVLTSIKPYEIKPGETEPNVYVFVLSKSTKVGDRDVRSAVVTKLGREFTFMVPMVKGADGSVAPDEAMVMTIAGLGPNKPVEIIASGATIKTIGAYEPARKAEFVKLGKQTVGTTEVQTVELKDGSASLTLMIPPDATSIAGRARDLKAGAAVIFRGRKDDKGLWLAELKPAPEEKAK